MHARSTVRPQTSSNFDCSLLDDHALLQASREGSTIAFATLCERHEGRLFRVALSIVRNEADAEDIVQESLMRAFINIAGFRGEAGVYTWLVRIVMNTSLMLLRKRSRRVTVSLDHGVQDDDPWIELLRHPGRDAEVESMEKEHIAMLRDAMQRLPERYRGLFIEWMTGDVSTAELAGKCSLTVAATKSRLRRGRQRVEILLRNSLQMTRAATR